MSPRLPLTESRIAIFGGLMLLAMVIRVVCSFLIGAGTFGPDGTGAEAAVQLGGHPNPILPLLIGFFGGGRGLSVFSGAVTAVACAKLGQRLGGNPWTCGLMGACAPLLVLPASMAGGDAPAIAFAASGVALAWWQKPFAGGLIAGLSLGVKAIALPILLLLPLRIGAPLSQRRERVGRWRRVSAGTARSTGIAKPLGGGGRVPGGDRKPLIFDVGGSKPRGKSEVVGAGHVGLALGWRHGCFTVTLRGCRQ